MLKVLAEHDQSTPLFLQYDSKLCHYPLQAPQVLSAARCPLSVRAQWGGAGGEGLRSPAARPPLAWRLLARRPNAARAAPHPNFQLARRRRACAGASLQEYQDRFAFMKFDNRRMYSAMVSFLDDQVP